MKSEKNTSNLSKLLKPTPSVKNINNYYPCTETLDRDEMRITFMGSRPYPPQRTQACTCIMVELGIGRRFFFDFGPGCLRNIIGMRVPIKAVNDIFLTHLHVDHFGDLPYLFTFSPHNGRFAPLRITGPSGRSYEDGTKAMIAGMKQMTAWNMDSIKIMPVGEGGEIEVNEFDWMDDNGICYRQDGVQVRHWRRSHTKDGASAFRLDWDGPSFVWTGDGRPDELTIKYSRGADIFITETMLDEEELRSIKWGTDTDIANYVMDTHHTPHYAAGYMMQQINPKVGFITHCEDDPITTLRLIDGIRKHWKGLLFTGFDLTVVNITKNTLWIRKGVATDSAENPKQDADPVIGKDSKDVIAPPKPTRTREDMQDQKTRDYEIDPKKFYPPDAFRNLITKWPK